MKSKEVLNLLRISRQTLTRYVSNGTIRIEVQPNKYYNYNDEDVYKILSQTLRQRTQPQQSCWGMIALALCSLGYAESLKHCFTTFLCCIGLSQSQQSCGI